MVEIMQFEMKSELRKKPNELKNESPFKFLSLMRFEFSPHPQAVVFLKYLKHKYKIIMMCSTTFDYFEKTLVSAGLKKANDKMIIIEETEENNFQKVLAHKFDEYKRSKFKDGDNEGKEFKTHHCNADSQIVNSRNVNKTHGASADYCK
jgi:hypothetical protein